MADVNIIGGVDTTDWTDEQRAELRGLLNEQKTAEQKCADVAKEAASPTSIIADKRREAEEAKQNATDLRAFADAKKKHGEDNIGTIETRGGMIIMRTAIGDECDTREKCYHELADKDEQAADFVWFRETKKAVLHPSGDRVDELCKKFPRLQKQIENMYTGLVNGLRVRALGK